MLLHQDKYKTIPYRADIATYNQMLSLIHIYRVIQGAFHDNPVGTDRGDEIIHSGQGMNQILVIRCV